MSKRSQNVVEQRREVLRVLQPFRLAANQYLQIVLGDKVQKLVGGDRRKLFVQILVDLPELNFITLNVVPGLVGVGQQADVVAIDDGFDDGDVGTTLAVLLRYRHLRRLPEVRVVPHNGIFGARQVVLELRVVAVDDGLDRLVGARCDLLALVVLLDEVVFVQVRHDFLHDGDDPLGHLQVAVLQAFDQNSQTAAQRQLVQDFPQAQLNLLVGERYNLLMFLGEGDGGESSVDHSLVRKLTANHRPPEVQRVDFHLPVEVVDGAVRQNRENHVEAVWRNLLVGVNGTDACNCLTSDDAFALSSQHFDGVFLNNEKILRNFLRVF